MRTGWKTIVAVAGLMLAGADPGAGKRPRGRAERGGAWTRRRDRRAAARRPQRRQRRRAAASNDPALAQDGAYAMTPKPHIGVPTDGAIGIQEQVTQERQSRALDARQSFWCR